MKLYRVTNLKFADTFNGQGASFEDGARWNSPGHPVIYFGLDMSTSLVEAANYHPSPRLVPKSHCKAIYQVDDSVPMVKLDANDLPDDWQAMPYPSTTQKIGDSFLTAKDALLLLVPSVAVGVGELLLAVANPLHPDIKKIELLETIQPVYSDRMFTGI